MSHAINLHDGTGIAITDPGLGVLLAYGSTVPTTANTYAPGCIFIKTNGTTAATVSYVNVGTKASPSFVSDGTTGAIVVSGMYGELTAPTDLVFFVASRAYQVQSIIFRPLVAGTGGACTGEIKKAASATAIASGTILHASTADLVGTVNTNQTLTLSTTAADILLASGDAVGLDITGVATAARGIVSILLLPV